MPPNWAKGDVQDRTADRAPCKLALPHRRRRLHLFGFMVQSRFFDAAFDRLVDASGHAGEIMSYEAGDGRL